MRAPRALHIACLTALAVHCTAAVAQEMNVDIASPQSLEAFLQARAAFHDTRFEQADDLFREVARMEPESALVHAYMGVLDYLLYRDPSAHFAHARSLAAARGVAGRMAEALVLYGEGDYDASERALQDVLDASPADPYARHVLGFVRTSAGRPAEGAETLRALLRDRPDFAVAWNHLGYALLELELTDEALEAMRAFVEEAPENPSAHDSYAEALARSGQVDAAIGRLARAVLLEPRYAYAWMHMRNLPP